SLGAQTLLERRAASGLASLVWCVGETVRREGRRIDPPPSLPLLSPAVGQGWELPWAIGAWIHAAAQCLPEGTHTRFDLGLDEAGWRLSIEAPWSAQRERLWRRIEERLAPAACQGEPRVLLLPAAWLRAS